MQDETEHLKVERQKGRQPREEQECAFTLNHGGVHSGHPHATPVPSAVGKRHNGTEVGSVSLSLPDPSCFEVFYGTP